MLQSCSIRGLLFMQCSSLDAGCAMDAFENRAPVLPCRNLLRERTGELSGAFPGWSTRLACCFRRPAENIRRCHGAGCVRRFGTRHSDQSASDERRSWDVLPASGRKLHASRVLHPGASAAATLLCCIIKRWFPQSTSVPESSHLQSTASRRSSPSLWTNRKSLPG